MSLMYNPNKENYMTLADLQTLPVPNAIGPRHQPYSFADYANTVIETLPRAGLKPVAAEFAVSKDNNRFFGVVALETNRDDVRWQLGLRGSHDQRVSRGLVVGESVSVCSNLMFSGAINMRTKQTTNIANRIGGFVLEAVEQMPGFFAVEEDIINRLHETKVRPSVGDAALAKIYREGGLSGAQLAVALDEWYKPSYDHGADMTAWRLEQAATEALKPRGTTVNMDTVADRSRVVRKQILELFRLH